MENETFQGLITTTEGLSPTKMYSVSLDDVKAANSQTFPNRGFRFVYGRTNNGEVFEFIKAGRLAKRDLNAMKALGVIEAISSSIWAPKLFRIPQGQVELSRTFELGKETKELFDRWAKAMS